MRRFDDLAPPRTGPASNPVLFGVARGLSEIFPPIREGEPEGDGDRGDENDAPDEHEAR